MPPKLIDVIMEPQLYYSDGDGIYITFEMIQEAVLELKTKGECDYMYQGIRDACNMNFTITMTPASSKRWKKTFHAFSNRIRRTIRTQKRRKEKQRRMMLKGKKYEQKD